MLYWITEDGIVERCWKSSLIPHAILALKLAVAFGVLEVISHSPCYTVPRLQVVTTKVGSHLSFPMLYWGTLTLRCNNAAKPGFSVQNFGLLAPVFGCGWVFFLSGRIGAWRFQGAGKIFYPIGRVSGENLAILVLGCGYPVN